jgi:hypothetical protein
VPHAWVFRRHAGARHFFTASKGIIMFYTIAALLLILWLVGLVSSYTLGGFIHVLLVIALVVVVLNLISGRRSV